MVKKKNTAIQRICCESIKVPQKPVSEWWDVKDSTQSNWSTQATLMDPRPGHRWILFTLGAWPWSWWGLCPMKTWPFTMYHPLTWPCQDLGAARHVVLTTSKFQLYNSSQVELLALLCKENQWVAWDYRIRSWKQVSVGTSWCFHLEVIDWIRCMQTSEQM